MTFIMPFPVLRPSPFKSYAPPALLATIVLLASLVAGCLCCTQPSSTFYYGNSYTINVTGLDGYSGSGITRILVPVPVSDGQPVYAAENVSRQTIIFPPPVSVFADYQAVNQTKFVNNTAWTASLVTTEHGPMIEFSSRDASLSDFMCLLGKQEYPSTSEHDAYKQRFDRAVSKPLSPESPEPAGKYTVPDIYSSGNYSSYLFIDGSLTPGSQTAKDISVEISYAMGISYANGGFQGMDYHIAELIPGNTTGWIPVTVYRD